MKIHDDGFTQSNLLGWSHRGRVAPIPPSAHAARTAWPRARVTRMREPFCPLFLIQDKPRQSPGHKEQETEEQERKTHLLPKGSMGRTQRDFPEYDGSISEFLLLQGHLVASH